MIPERYDDIDYDGIDAEIVFPNKGLTNWQSPDPVEEAQRVANLGFRFSGQPTGPWPCFGKSHERSRRSLTSARDRTAPAIP